MRNSFPVEPVSRPTIAQCAWVVLGVVQQFDNGGPAPLCALFFGAARAAAPAGIIAASDGTRTAPSLLTSRVPPVHTRADRDAPRRSQALRCRYDTVLRHLDLVHLSDE
jgi:hypothetical protein